MTKEHVTLDVTNEFRGIFQDHSDHSFALRLYHRHLDEATCWEQWEKRHSGLESGVMTDCDSHVQPASRIYTIHSRHSDEHEHPCF